MKRLAAIDIGTNSIHMVIADVEPALSSFTIVAAEKETVRLGERCARTGDLSELAIARSLGALKRFRGMCRTLRVEEVVAVATSATREAANGRGFIERIEAETGIAVELISGQEEARRIYLGVLSAVDFGGQPHIVLDIGGGSTELILGDGRDPDYLSSTKIGAVRLTDEFVREDPIGGADFARLQQYVVGMLERPTDELRGLLEGKPPRLVGTSGTIEAVAGLVGLQATGFTPETLQGYEISLAAVEQAVRTLRRSAYSERAQWVGERRAEIVLAGAVVLQEAMGLLGATGLRVCTRSLREGLIVNWMLERGVIADRYRYQSEIAQRSVLRLARKYAVNLDYGQQVAHLAEKLFDGTRGVLHDCGDRERELLRAAALLHNCGHFISHEAHHKHSYYLIRHGNLLGFTEMEIEAIANLARYHRKSPPKNRHENFQRLANSRLKLFVEQVYPLLRLAVALDRRQIGAIAAVEVQCDLKSKRCLLTLEPKHPSDPCEMELWSLSYKKESFEERYGLRLEVRLRVPAERIG
ncbi:MAG: Ppx/GppA family phosphatase [Oscillatoriales cyanobacterium SM2_1_8]|nr:Ppx/GppA family phosphatase [Oscillatoriales cyanobacterium SM2_1_8]